MKTYKCIVFSILMLIGILNFISTLSAYSGLTEVLLIGMFIGTMWFNWKYAEGRWPKMHFFQAVGMEWMIGAVGIYLSINYFSNTYDVNFNFVFNYFLNKSPSIYISPIIMAPITVLFWRWAFKEVREATNKKPQEPTKQTPNTTDVWK
ncbi:hypothetical protein ACHHZ2_12655 [Citrobacter freundii complex sp. 2024EL-00237]|uniref:hypothetical protein n=1 Tax=Citrobacter freundii complex sp. 2024EL-00237 TaxID=3374253 RepID=UPI003751AEE4